MHMGLFDWLKKGRGSSRKTVTPPPSAKPEEQIVPPNKDEIKEIEKELSNERKRNLQQERRMKEMEERFNKMQENWTSLLEKQQIALEKMSGELRSAESTPSPPKTEVGINGTKEDPSIAISQTIVEEKKFENFVVDDANRFPYLAAEAVATGVGKRYNPLFIYGDVGVGKTHLLHAIARLFLYSQSKASCPFFHHFLYFPCNTPLL